MVGFTYDDEAYADPDLDAWLLEVGRLLREQRDGSAKPKAGKPKQPAGRRSPKRSRKPAPKADG